MLSYVRKQNTNFVFLAAISPDYEEGTGFIRFISNTFPDTVFTGELTGTDDGCTDITYTDIGIPFGTVTQNYFHVSLLRAIRSRYATKKKKTEVNN